MLTVVCIITYSVQLRRSLYRYSESVSEVSPPFSYPPRQSVVPLLHTAATTKLSVSAKSPGAASACFPTIGTEAVRGICRVWHRP